MTRTNVIICCSEQDNWLFFVFDISEDDKFYAQTSFVKFLWIQHVCQFTSRDMGYYPDTPGILCSIILFSFRDIWDIAGR